MAAGGAILSALKVVAKWVDVGGGIVAGAAGAVDKVAKIKEEHQGNKIEEHLRSVDDRLNQVGAAALELEQKLNVEMEALRKQVRALKILILAIGVAVIGLILYILFK